MRQEAVLLATLFLNFIFWYDYGNAFWLPYSFPISALIIAAASALLALLFLIGPALAVHRSNRGLFPALENSFGTVPTHVLRVFVLWFSFSFLSDLLLIVPWQLPSILRRDATPTDTLLTAAVLLGFLAYTALQSHETNVTVARFTNRLGVAVLIAAIIRLHDAWPKSIPILFETYPSGLSVFDLQRLSRLAFDLAPLGLLASAFAQRIETEKDVVRTGLLGFAVPLCATCIVVSTINLATRNSSFYQPSQEPNIAMALWGGAARNARPGPILIAIVTTFGAFRFGIRAIPTSIPNPRLHLPAVFTILTLTLTNLARLEYSQEHLFHPEFNTPAVVLAIVTAILSADALHNQPTNPKQINWPAATALILALTLAYTIAQSTDPALESWGHPWLFPAYLTAFTITLASRKLKRT